MNIFTFLRGDIILLFYLKIKNIAIIENLTVNLENGLNVLTGETGAGKSILIDSLSAVLGNRVSKELIRTGTQKAFVEALFKIDKTQAEETCAKFGIPLEDDGTLILQREINQNGKNLCHANNRLITVTTLKSIGEKLIDIHGQNDNQSLLKSNKHIELLDNFGQEHMQALKLEYLKKLNEFKQLEKEMEKLNADPAYRQRRIDILNFQIKEIEEANLKPNEDEELQNTRLVLANSQKIKSAFSNAYSLLYQSFDNSPSAYDKVNNAISEFISISHIDSQYQDLFNRIEGLSFEIQDISETINNSMDIEKDAESLLVLTDERLDTISTLKRKYGNSIDEILSFLDNAKHELLELESSEEKAQSLNEKYALLNKKLLSLAKSLNYQRKTQAQILEKNISQQLNDLEIKNANFKVDVSFKENHDINLNKYTQRGLCDVEFLISTNLGEPLKPLAKIASGGEMSRIMLAIKTILADIDETPTLIFDEVDSGISGKAAIKVGKKLSFLAKTHQVICITHLAQIASLAHNHFLIQKTQDENKTITSVIKLNDEKRISEIARLTTGDSSSKISIKHAEEMLKNSEIRKKL